MTGFGQAAGENRRHAVSVAIRTVNHRFLDVKLRLADEYRQSEAPLRDLLSRELSRGRVDVTVDVRVREEREATVELHRGIVRATHTALHELVTEGLIDRELTAGDLLRLPEAMSIHLAADSWDDDDQALVTEVAERALAQVVAARSLEGKALGRALLERVTGLERAVEELSGLAATLHGEIAASLRERVGRLLEGRELDEPRLAHEVALLADRSDVSEELDRLGSHLEHFREVVEQASGVGKRLDFLTQEIFREINTLGAKCRNAEMTRLVLDAKGLTEQLREQVQNVE